MIDLDAPVANLVLAHSATATVLDRRQIDYCCEGHRPLAQVIADRGLDGEALVAELTTAMAAPDLDADPRTASTSALINRSLAQQHRHLRALFALLELQGREVVRRHATTYPALRPLVNLVEELAEHLLTHLDREEDELFPAMLAGAMTPELRASLGVMFDEHREFAQALRRLRQVGNGYQAPAGAPIEVIELYAALHELELLVVRHHHVENHALLPRFR